MNKHVAQDKKRVPIWRYLVKFLLLPITLYVILGTTLFFLFRKVDTLSQWLRDRFQLPALGSLTPTESKKESIWLTVFWPIETPFIAVQSLLVLIYALIATILRLIYDALAFILKSIKRQIEDVRGDTAKVLDR